MPLEAMSLGVPCVATAWSGNLSYMNHSNSCLIRSSLKSVPINSEPFGFLSTGVRNVWADPNIDHASRWLAKLKNEPILLKSLSVAARKAYDLYFEEAVRVAFANELFCLYSNLIMNSPKNRNSIIRLARLNQSIKWRRDRLSRFFKSSK
jgi:hypothetical protein